MKLGGDVELRRLAAQTPGFSGAQLAGAANQAALVANRRITEARRRLAAEGKSQAEIEQAIPLEVTLSDFDEGITRVQMGPASNKAMTDEDKKNTAYHELGHAYISQVMHDEKKGGDPVTKITIVPRAKALGYTQSLPQGDRYNYTDEQLRARIMMAMGGRVAQEVFLNTVDTGASNDFQQATNIAYRMVTEFGMSKLGPIHSSGNNSNPFLGRTMAMEKPQSQDLLAKIDEAWLEIVNECYVATRKLIEADRECFEHIANVLLAKETILGPEWEQLFAERTCRRGTRPDGEGTAPCVNCETAVETTSVPTATEAASTAQKPVTIYIVVNGGEGAAYQLEQDLGIKLWANGPERPPSPHYVTKVAPEEVDATIARLLALPYVSGAYTKPPAFPPGCFGVSE
jgi:cell division protease FtsH